MIGFKKVFDYFTLILLTVLAPPTLAILITWNTLPGESLYSLKQKLEDAALFVASANFGTKSDLHAKIVDRRFQETTELLESSSGIGLPELTTEIDSVKQDLIKKAAKTTKAKDAKVVKDKTEKMITQLREYDQELEKEKQKLTQQTSSQVIVKEVYQTQKEIQVIVKELEVVKETVVVIEQSAPAQNNSSVITSPFPSPSPKLTPSPSPFPSPSSEPGDFIPPMDAGPPVAPSAEPAPVSPSPTMNPSPLSSPVVSPSPKAPSASSITITASPSPDTATINDGETQGEATYNPFNYYQPLIWGAVACVLIGFLTLVFIQVRER